MITVLTGTPGSGKTSWLISYLISEIKKGRIIYVDNVPDLVLDVRKAGKIDQWHKGTWLGIDTYDPDDGDPDSNWTANGNGQPDKGALIVSDEAQRWFRPRGGRTVPEHVAALEVHRHQGLDFLFITQNLSLLDANLKVLCSKHIHIRLGSFGRKVYEWPEVANPNSRQQREAAAKSSYKPDPAVFGLYKSATLHTKLKHKLPNAAAVIALCLVGFLVLGYFVYDQTFSQLFGESVSASELSESGSGSAAIATKERRASRPEPEPVVPAYAVVVGIGRFSSSVFYIIEMPTGEQVLSSSLDVSFPDSLVLGSHVPL